MSERKNGDLARMVVFVAVEPRAYADVIGATLAELRPRFDVSVVDPAEIYHRARNPCVGLVLCSRPMPRSAEGRPYWVEYNPYAEAPSAEFRVNGVATDIGNPTLNELLEILDGVNLPGRVCEGCFGQP